VNVARPLLRDALASLTASAPVPYVSTRYRTPAPSLLRQDRTSQLHAMGSVGTLFSIVNRTSNATSQVEWRLYRKRVDGRRNYGPAGDTRTEVVRHQALKVWEKPNDFMPRQEFVETFQQHVDLCGEAWWVIEHYAGTRLPAGMWPVRPDRMVPIPSPTDFLAGYVYLGPDGEHIPLALDEVVMLRMPDPENLYRGMGPVQAILTDLDAKRLASEYARAFFTNSAMPGGIIEFPEGLSDPEFEEFTERWREQHQGVSGAHRVAILERGKWVDRSYSMKDMQFAELRDVSSATIREAFGMPKFAIGDVDDVNRATADASASWFAQYLTVPRLERIKQALNFDFLPLFGDAGQGLEFDYDSPVPEDLEREAAQLTAKANAAKVLVDAGFAPADSLETAGLPPMRFTGRPTAPTAPRPPEGGDDGPDPAQDDPAPGEAA
jgi:HK97 family phage portal protein